jgi:hypothetical protein
VCPAHWRLLHARGRATATALLSEHPNGKLYDLNASIIF